MNINFPRKIYILGSIIFGLCYGYAQSFTQLYFVRNVSNNVYIVSNLIELMLGAFILSVSTNEKIRELLKKVFILIIVGDCLGFTIISLLGLEHVAIRFIGLAILNATTRTLYVVILRDIMNGCMNGEKLTTLQTLIQSISMWTAAIGYIGALFIKIDVDTAILIMSFGCYMMGGCDAFISIKTKRREIS